MSINKVIIVGNVGQEPEIRNTQDGREIASFSIATTESWKDKNSGEKKEKTEWHRIAIFSPNLVSIVKLYVKIYLNEQDQVLCLHNLPRSMEVHKPCYTGLIDLIKSVAYILL